MIDSHAHLQAEAFARDLSAVLRRAAAASVTRILVPGWDLASSRAAIRLAGERDGVRLVAAAGIHPHGAARVSKEDWAALATRAGEEAVVAVGKTGLDYDRMFSPRDSQLANLRRHLALARAIGKPLILWVRVTADWLAGQRHSEAASIERDLAASFERIFEPVRPA